MSTHRGTPGLANVCFTLERKISRLLFGRLQYYNRASLIPSNRALYSSGTSGMKLSALGLFFDQYSQMPHD